MGGGKSAECEWGELLTMPIDYLVTDTELSDIADAIRAKGGTSAPLVYPTGFVSAINDIPSGGTSDFEVHPVTITSSDRVTFLAPFLSTYPPDSLGAERLIYPATPTTVNFVFYKGRCYTGFGDMWIMYGAAAFDDEYGSWYFTGEGSVSMERD